MKVIEGAEHVLRRDGLDSFSMTAVAEASGLSIGGIYRRFANREALLLAIKEKHIDGGLVKIAAELKGGRPNLAETVNAYVGSLVRNYANEERLYSALLIANAFDDAMRDSSTRLKSGHGQIFDSVFLAHHEEITHPVPSLALSIALEVILAVIIRRLQWIGMGRKLAPSWAEFQEELSLMIISYLTAEPAAGRGIISATKGNSL